MDTTNAFRIARITARLNKYQNRYVESKAALALPNINAGDKAYHAVRLQDCEARLPGLAYDLDVAMHPGDDD